MAEVTLEGVSKRFRTDSDFLVRRFGVAGPAVVQDSDEPGAPVETVVKALDDVTLRVRDGETVSIIGPSGSGKSTLLRVVAGLEEPDSGRVLYDGQDMAEVPPKDRGIGMVFQNYALYPHMESRMNLGFFFLLRKRKQEIPERVRITSEIMGVGFEELLDRKPRELSGGQQQRVAIARCISRDPVLFLLDEPLSNLDAKLRVRTRVEIKRLLRRFGITTLYVTHDQTEAMALGDRIAVMNHGRVEQVGTYRELFDRPRNAFVATFLGTPPMNLLTARVDPQGRHTESEAIRLSSPSAGPEWFGREVTAGVRAEHLAPTSALAEARLLLSVEVIEPLVQERMQLVHGSAGGQRVVAKLPADLAVRRGDVLPLCARPEHLHLFDPVSRRRLNAIE